MSFWHCTVILAFFLPWMWHTIPLTWWPWEVWGLEDYLWHMMPTPSQPVPRNTEIQQGSDFISNRHLQHPRPSKLCFFPVFRGNPGNPKHHSQPLEPWKIYPLVGYWGYEPTLIIGDYQKGPQLGCLLGVILLYSYVAKIRNVNIPHVVGIYCEYGQMLSIYSFSCDHYR